MRMPRRSALQGVAAAVLALGLLSGTGGTFAAWAEARTLPGASFSSGSLGLTVGTPTVLLTHTDFVAGATSTTQVERLTTDITADAPTHPLVPGDVVTVTSDVVITAKGTNLKATLAANPAALAGDAALVSEINANNPAVSFAPKNGAPQLVSNGTNQWAITSANDGATYVMTLQYTTRPTTNGGARVEDGSESNWWKSTLQGAALSPRNLPFSLTQTR